MPVGKSREAYMVSASNLVQRECTHLGYVMLFAAGFCVRVYPIAEHG